MYCDTQVRIISRAECIPPARIITLMANADTKPKPRPECLPPSIPLAVGQFLSNGPSACYLEITPACNNRCPGCANNEFIEDFDTRRLKLNFRHPILNQAQWDRILDKLSSSINFINLSGGEPTLHKDFEEIAASIDRRNIDFVIFSNGRWQNPQRLVSFLQKLPHFRGFLISLHGSTSAAHEGFSGVLGSFEETVANVALATHAKLPVSISVVITHENVGQLNRLADLARKLEADEIVFNRYLVPLHREEQSIPGGMLKGLVPTPIELKEAVQIVERLRDAPDDVLRINYGPCIPQCFTPSSSEGCSAGETFFVVDPWGNVKPCIHTTLVCGNLLEQDMMKIWYDEALNSWRGLIPSGCSGCAALSKCRTGCRAMALASGLGRDPLMMEPLGELISEYKIDQSKVIPLLTNGAS